MELLLMINSAILLLVSFFVTKKTLKPFENIFLFMIFVFLFTSYFTIIDVNLRIWEIKEQNEPFLAFQIFEIIVLPIIYLFFFNYWTMLKYLKNKLLLSIGLISICYGIEYLFIVLDIVTYQNWMIWQSLLVFLLFLIVGWLLLQAYRYVLRKERIIKL